MTSIIDQQIVDEQNLVKKKEKLIVSDIMSGSMASISSSLASPGDSGVQLLDSESDILSIMSMSGQEFTFNDTSSKHDLPTPDADHRISVIWNSEFPLEESAESTINIPVTTNLMTDSDIVNQNTTPPMYDYKIYSKSAPNVSETTFEVSEKVYSKSAPVEYTTKTPTILEDIILKASNENNANRSGYKVYSKSAPVSLEESTETDTSTTPPEPIIDKEDLMQTSVIAPIDDQIVYRRQRRKKLKSDTPKKRVSFHEDILNSTKIDDIHIDRGFITRQPCVGYFEDARKHGIVVGRYSWAAEGDSQYSYHQSNEREVKSDLIYGNSMYNNSNSSSSSMSLDSSDSNSIDSPKDEYAPSVISGIQNIKKKPKSSCLKKPKHNRNVDTVVQEDCTTRRRKTSDSSILIDTGNIFGSLKNIYRTLSSSVPLTERGVPEGQEDYTTYTSAENLQRLSKRNSYSSNETLVSKSFDDKMTCVAEPVEVTETAQPSQMYKKPNLRLSRSEGFYPNYPNPNQEHQENIILCDSNVYEHRGISYSYEYDQFQNSFNQTPVKNKGSTVYQMILNEINFLKKPETTESRNTSPKKTSTPVKTDRKGSSVASDWSNNSDSESEISEKPSKHLQSPLRKRNIKPNHYSIQNTSLKIEDNSEIFSDMSSVASGSADKIPLVTLKPATSKSSLINRFLRNVTQKKMIDAKLLSLKTGGNEKNILGLNFKKAKPDIELCKALDEEILEEVSKFEANRISPKVNEINNLRHKVQPLFRDQSEMLVDIYKVKTAYDKNGENHPMLMLLTNNALYVSTLSRTHTYYSEFIIPYTELHFILIGPNKQTIYVSNTNKTLHYMILTGDAEQTNQIIGRVEYAMRKDPNKPRLPAIKELTLTDLGQLRQSIHEQTSVTKDEDFYHYSLINIQDDQVSPPSTPLGPFREGFLMYRKAQTDYRWQFAYFILKGGVLYMLTSPTCRIPVKVIPLQNGACNGAHRTPAKPRPHTFELLTDTESLEFAASDEYEASEWLQSLVQAASGMQLVDDLPQTTACSLVITTDHLVTVRESFEFENVESDKNAIKALSYAAISDLTAFKIPLAAQSWCVLEFACREVNETSGDWILYFKTNAEMDAFLSVMEILWSYSNSQGDSFPLTTVTETESLNRQASETYRALQQSWVAFQ